MTLNKAGDDLAGDVQIVAMAPKDTDFGTAKDVGSPLPTTDTPPPAARRALAAARAVADVLLENWFILGLGAAIGLAAALPQLGRTGGWIRAEYSVKIPAIVLIFVISGIGLKTKVLLGALASTWVHVRIQGVSLVIVPALGYALSLGLRAAGFNRYLTDGLVVMAAMPTTVSTNVVFTARAFGNEAAALVNAVIGNLIGIFITPLWLTLFLDVSGQAPYSKVLIELTYTVIAPLIFGQLLQYGLPKPVAWVKARVNTANVSSFCILLLVWATFSNTFADPRHAAGARDAFAVVGLDALIFWASVIISFLVGYPPIGRRGRELLRANSKADAVAIVICGSTKTVALGVPLINVMYGKTEFAGLLATPLIVYHASQILLGGVMLGPLGRWATNQPVFPRRARATEATAADPITSA